VASVIQFQRRLVQRLPNRSSVVTFAAAFAVGAILALIYPTLREKLDIVYPTLRETVDGVSPPQLQSSPLFGMCGGFGRYNCVIDGDTFYSQGLKIRIADIDTPETHPPRCEYERELGARATRRLNELLNVGPFELVKLGNRDEDRYGRKLRVVLRNGRSLGDVLVAEGLARTWTGRRQPWC
jgi:endonuclease YncB( thermonuclease family)